MSSPAAEEKDARTYNVGASDYAKHAIQPYDIWDEYKLNPYDADIIKRVLRTKTVTDETADRILDYEKIIHVCRKRIQDLKNKTGYPAHQIK